jgi:hypothetical protein
MKLIFFFANSALIIMCHIIQSLWYSLYDFSANNVVPLQCGAGSNQVYKVANFEFVLLALNSVRTLISLLYLFFSASYIILFALLNVSRSAFSLANMYHAFSKLITVVATSNFVSNPV